MPERPELGEAFWLLHKLLRNLGKRTKRRGLKRGKKSFSPSFWHAALWENDFSLSA